MQVPDAVYHLMRHTELKTCDLSGNVITKIPPKFASKFSLITSEYIAQELIIVKVSRAVLKQVSYCVIVTSSSAVLNLSHNQMSKLPEELAGLACLSRLDISHNSFITLPQVVFKMAKLKQLLANNNNIIEVDADEGMINSDSLELVDLRNNPLTPQCHTRLQNATVRFHIELSERQKEDWEDLTI